MPPIKIQHIVSVSSEDKNHPADNLLKAEGTFKWKSAVTGEKSISVVLQFEKASEIQSIDIGNEGSGFVEVLVGKSTALSASDYQVILVASSFMTPIESRNGTNRNSVRMFGPDKLSKVAIVEKWDRVKVVCTQPFCKTATYGISFIKFHSHAEHKEAEKTSTLGNFGAFKIKRPEDDNIQVGSLFAKRNDKVDPPPLKGAAAVRAASKLAEESRPLPKVSRVPTPPPSKPSPAKRKHGASSDEEEIDPPAKTPLRKHSTSVSSVKSTSSKGEATPPLKRTKSEPPKTSSSFHQLMNRVVFVISGYQNPYRGELRERAMEMGAQYRSDWGRGCTHLICAFANTPKYNAVVGQGKIVTKAWINDCYKQKRLLSWERYRLDDEDESSDEGSSSSSSYSDESDEEYKIPKKDAKKVRVKKTPPVPSKKPVASKVPVGESYGGDTDSGEDTEDEIRRAKEKVAKHDASASGKVDKTPVKKAVDPYGNSTDEEDNEKPVMDDGSDSGLPDLPDFFADKHFFLYGEFPSAEKRLLTRYIAAYDGCLEDYMSGQVKFVVTASKWDDNFEEALNENANLVFIKPKWVHTCHERNKLVPHQPYIVVPA